MNNIITGIIGFVVGFIAANFILYTNHPTIRFVMDKIMGGRTSMMRIMMEEDNEFKKRHKVKYKKT